MFVCTCTCWYGPFVSATDNTGTNKTNNACVLLTHDNQSVLTIRVLLLPLTSLVFVELCMSQGFHFFSRLVFLNVSLWATVFFLSFHSRPSLLRTSVLHSVTIEDLDKSRWRNRRILAPHSPHGTTW